jgi:hypothetical protein
MPDARFIHVGLAFDRPGIVEALKQTFESALDWCRYDLHCWILYTTTDINTWRDRIRNTPGITDDDAFFLCEFKITDNGYSGYMHDWVWTWLQKDRAT